MQFRHLTHNDDLPPATRDLLPEDDARTLFRNALNEGYGLGHTEIRAYARAYRVLDENGWKPNGNGKYAKEKDDPGGVEKGWVTINGHHVLIGEDEALHFHGTSTARAESILKQGLKLSKSKYGGELPDQSYAKRLIYASDKSDALGYGAATHKDFAIIGIDKSAFDTRAMGYHASTKDIPASAIRKIEFYKAGQSTPFSTKVQKQDEDLAWVAMVDDDLLGPAGAVQKGLPGVGDVHVDRPMGAVKPWKQPDDEDEEEDLEKGWVTLFGHHVLIGEPDDSPSAGRSISTAGHEITRELERIAEPHISTQGRVGAAAAVLATMSPSQHSRVDVMRDRQGTLLGAVQTRTSAEHLEVSFLAVNPKILAGQIPQKHVGTDLMVHAAQLASAKGLGVKLESLDHESSKFYHALGMTRTPAPYGNNLDLFSWTPAQATSIAKVGRISVHKADDQEDNHFDLGEAMAALAAARKVEEEIGGPLAGKTDKTDEPTAKRFAPPTEVRQAAAAANDLGTAVIDITSVLAEGEGLAIEQIRKIAEHFDDVASETDSPTVLNAWGGPHAAKWAYRVLRKFDTVEKGSDADCNWVTMHGSHICIGGDGRAQGNSAAARAFNASGGGKPGAGKTGAKAGGGAGARAGDVGDYIDNEANKACVNEGIKLLNRAGIDKKLLSDAGAVTIVGKGEMGSGRGEMGSYVHETMELFVKGSKDVPTFIHEYGHHLHMHIEEYGAKPMQDLLKASNAEWKRAVSTKNPAHALSDYSKTDKYEWHAEAFRLYHGSPRDQARLQSVAPATHKFWQTSTTGGYRGRRNAEVDED